MIAVVQRVSEAGVSVAATSATEAYESAIGPGLLALLGVEVDDTTDAADRLARKVSTLRIFDDEDGRLNRSIIDIGGEALVVSQFTLAGTLRKGTRPSFERAAPASLARPLYERFVERLRTTHGVPTRTGVFQAMMKVRLVNDGPVTLILRSDPDR